MTINKHTQLKITIKQLNILIPSLSGHSINYPTEYTTSLLIKNANKAFPLLFRTLCCCGDPPKICKMLPRVPKFVQLDVTLTRKLENCHT